MVIFLSHNDSSTNPQKNPKQASGDETDGCKRGDSRGVTKLQ